MYTGGAAGLTDGTSTASGAGQTALKAIEKGFDSTWTAEAPLQYDFARTRWWIVRGAPSGAANVAVVRPVWMLSTPDTNLASSERWTT